MRELGIKRIEAHVAAVCVTPPPNPLLLAMHRSWDRTLFPGYWEGPGGQVHEEESFPEAVLRHLREEAGITGHILEPITTYVIEPGTISGAEERIPGIRFLVLMDQPVRTRLDPRQHQGSQWMPIDHISEVRWIPGVLPQLEQAISRLRLFSA